MCIRLVIELVCEWQFSVFFVSISFELNFNASITGHFINDLCIWSVFTVLSHICMYIFLSLIPPIVQEIYLIFFFYWFLVECAMHTYTKFLSLSQNIRSKSELEHTYIHKHSYGYNFFIECIFALFHFRSGTRKTMWRMLSFRYEINIRWNEVEKNWNRDIKRARHE